MLLPLKPYEVYEDQLWLQKQYEHMREIEEESEKRSENMQEERKINKYA